MLAQLVSHSGGTPQVLSSTPRGSEFQAESKKIHSLAPCAVSQCQGRARVRGFSQSGKPMLLLKLIPVGRSFHYSEMLERHFLIQANKEHIRCGDVSTTTLCSSAP